MRRQHMNRLHGPPKEVASLHRYQAGLAFGEDLGELGAFDLAALNLAGLRANDVQLKHGLGQIPPMATQTPPPVDT